ncbi:MAG: NADH-quinone oxidoreductase subunit N [Bacteroidetes bacterium]|nr:NADH-quinone oxidoreductase subunit N [Bacteroidota bacterium]MBK8674575.1 NADH-quinone oxidoreductase subunit N [Bacteroidota bacterium]
MSAIIALFITGVLVLYLGVFGQRKVLLPISITGIFIAFSLVLFNVGLNLEIDNHMLVFDQSSRIYSLLLLFIMSLVFLLSEKNMNYASKYKEDVYGLMIFSTIGGLMLLSYANLVTLFLGIETLSIPLYVLVGSKKSDLKSNEAAMKYFIMGSFATCFLLLGMALIYGAVGSFDFREIALQCYTDAGRVNSLFEMGILFLLFGMIFKVSAAPFHFWTPDVYEGAPSIITVFMATVVKIAGFGALARLLRGGFPDSILFVNFLWIIAVLTMTVGNLGATQQKSIKRLLAFSSIAHAGVMMIAVLAVSKASMTNVFIYLLAYSLATIILFTLFMHFADKKGLSDISSFNGLGKTNPFLAATSTLALLSLAGIPITAGFFGKYYIFYNAINQGYIWLVILGLLNSAIAIYYYLGLIIAMYFKEPVEMKSETDDLPFLHKLVIAGCALAIIIIGIYPNRLMMLF